MDRIRKPRFEVLINDLPTTSGLDIEVANTRRFKASSFRIEADPRQLAEDLGSSWSTGALSVQIKVSMGAVRGSSSTAQGITLINGMVDSVDYEPSRPRLVLSGRDRSASLIDQPLSSSYLNRTSSEIVTELASGAGLSVDVDPTARLIGQYYQIQHNKNSLSTFSRHASSWDLIVELAQLEGFDLWCSNGTLHFKSRSDKATADTVIQFDAGTKRYTSPSLNVMSLVVHRHSFPDNVPQVRVSSWNSKQKTVVRAYYPSVMGDYPLIYGITKPNLLLEEAQCIAKETYRQIVGQQRTITSVMAGELGLTARSVIQLTGLGSGWDGLYEVDRLDRRLSFEGGFSQQVTARVIAGGDANV